MFFILENPLSPQFKTLNLGQIIEPNHDPPVHQPIKYSSSFPLKTLGAALFTGAFNAVMPFYKDVKCLIWETGCWVEEQNPTTDHILLVAALRIRPVVKHRPHPACWGQALAKASQWLPNACQKLLHSIHGSGTRFHKTAHLHVFVPREEE